LGIQDPLLELLSMHTQGQGDKEIHHQEHGRIGRYPYVINPLPTAAQFRELGISSWILYIGKEKELA
jgi:hypothetical protein